MKRETGRPVSNEGRIENEIKTYDFLDRLGVCYERIDHAPAMTMEDCAEVDLALEATVCKNLVLCNRQQTVFYLLMIPGDKRFSTKELSHQLGVSRLSFVGPELLKSLLDVTAGSVSVLCLQSDTENRVQLLVDRDVMDGEFIGCHPCINTSSLRLMQSDLWERILPALHHTYRVVTLAGESKETNHD